MKFTEGQAYISPAFYQRAICDSIDDHTLKCETQDDQEKITTVSNFTDNFTKLSIEMSIPAIGKSYTEYYHLL